MEKVAVSCRLDPDAVKFLDTLGANLERERSYLIKDAIMRYIDMHRWQMEEIERGIAEAEAGDFVPDAEVREMFRKWTHES